MRKIIIGIIVLASIGIILSFLLRSIDFAFGLILGTLGSLFWIISLNLDVKKFVISGNINRVKLGYLMRLMVGAGVLGIALGISIRTFFGSCLGLMFLKLGAYMSFLFSLRRGSDEDKVGFIEER